MTTPNSFPLTGPDPLYLADGSPRPTCPITRKPLMTLVEANWHSHVSGVTARQEAQSAGADPISASALLAPGAQVIGGILLQPMTIGTSLTMERLHSAYIQQSTGTPLAMGAMEVARNALVFSDAPRCWQLLEEGNLQEIERLATELAFKISASVLQQINAFIAREVADFFGSEEVEEKKSISPPDEPRGAEGQSEPPASSAPTADLSPGGPSPSSNS